MHAATLLFRLWMPSVTKLELLLPLDDRLPHELQFFLPFICFPQGSLQMTKGQYNSIWTTHSPPHLAQVRVLFPVNEFLGAFPLIPYAPVMAGHWELISVLISCRHYARQMLIYSTLLWLPTSQLCGLLPTTESCLGFHFLCMTSWQSLIDMLLENSPGSSLILPFLPRLLLFFPVSFFLLGNYWLGSEVPPYPLLPCHRLKQFFTNWSEVMENSICISLIQKMLQ